MSNFNLFSSLQCCGKSLAKLLAEAKSKNITAETPIHNRVETAITGLINDLKLCKDGEFTTEECFTKVVKKIEWTLGELMKYDAQNASRYGELTTTVSTFESTFSRNLPTLIAAHYKNNNNNNSNDYNNNNNNNNNNSNSNINGVDTNIDFENLYSRLVYHQKILLELFFVLPQGTEVKENDLFHCWFSLNLVFYDVSERPLKVRFEEHLNNLVENKIIERVVTGVTSVRKYSKREGFKYAMPNITSVRKYVRQLPANFRPIGDIFVNTDASNLTTKRLNSVTSFILNSYCIMLQLGSWNNNPRKYIVVEDMDALIKVLSKLNDMKFVSLQGVSGLVELPSLAIIAETLKVLILKGCHNLESLSPQFKTLHKWKLRYLDMSECYLLDHPPDALSGCIKLEVLKGFVLLNQQPLDQPFISNPSQFQHLWKLTLRTKRLNFPTNSDLETLCQLQSLTHLKITWVGACSNDDNQDVQFNDNSNFPPKLTKFEMEAASDSTSKQILKFITRQKDALTNVPDSDTTPVSLKKLYIKGGNLSKLEHNVDCKILRLHYLPNMQHSCYDRMRTFPTLHRLEMSKDVMYSMLRQSFQKATGTNDDNSGWEPSFARHAAPSSTS